MPTRFARHRSRLRVGAAAIALGALGVMAAVALAANPVSGAKYKGHIENNPVNTKISFKVSGNGTEVRHLKTKLDPIFNAAPVRRHDLVSDAEVEARTHLGQGEVPG